MLGTGQGLAAIAAATALAAGCGDESEPLGAARALGSAHALAAQRSAGHQLFWAGRTFEGLALTAVSRDTGRTTFAYGTCEPPEGEGGCAPPLQIQTASLCHDNALKVALRPRASFRVRGTIVRDYGEGRLDLDAATTLIRVFGQGSRSRRALAALRPVSASSRVAARLPAARYPNHYLEQLREVRDAYRRGGSLHAVRAELGISVSAARFQLALARGRGPAGLSNARGVVCDEPPPQ